MEKEAKGNELKELKAQAYDLLSMVEMYQNELRRVNDKIIKLSQLEAEEVSKEDK